MLYPNLAQSTWATAAAGTQGLWVHLYMKPSPERIPSWSSPPPHQGPLDLLASTAAAPLIQLHCCRKNFASPGLLHWKLQTERKVCMPSRLKK